MALSPKWRPKVTTIEESKDLSTLSLDELIGNLQVYEVVLEKDRGISKGNKDKYKSLDLKAKKDSSDDETSTSGSEDEEYAITVRDFIKLFRRKGRFFRQPHNEKKSFRKVKDDKKGKRKRKCFRCGDPNYFIGECPKPLQKEQTAFIGGSWSESEEEGELKKDEICLMAHESNKNEKLKQTQDILVKQASKLIKFENIAYCLNEMLNNQKSPKDKKGLGFTDCEASTSKTKHIKFTNSVTNTVSDGLDLPEPFEKDPATCQLVVVAKERKLSDHCPFVIVDKDVDFGTNPFRLFDASLYDSECEKVELVRDLDEAELDIWKEARNGWLEKDRRSNEMKKQKSRVKWVLQGDENLKFFHSESNNSIPVLVNGNFKTISSEDREELECFIQGDEVWDAIKQCGSIKAQCPDGFNFGDESKKMAWVRWNVVIKKTKVGGLNIGGLKLLTGCYSASGSSGFNLKKTEYGLKLLKVCMKFYGGLRAYNKGVRRSGSTWSSIVNVGRVIDRAGVNFCSSFRRKVCNDYGVVVDAFIPYKKSKAERKPSAPSHPSNANESNSPGSYVFILKSGKMNNVMSDHVLPSLILDDSSISDRYFSLSLMGKVMEAWDPFICNDSYESESSDDEEDAKDDGSHSRDKVTTYNDVKRDKVLSDDPFNLYDILNKRKDSGDDLKYLPSFTPSVINMEEVNKKVKGATSNEIFLLKELNDINSIDSLEAAQKSKVRWAIEGDENTKFFHGILNSKRFQLAIRGPLLMASGLLSLEQQANLERNVSNEEIKTVKEFFASGLFSGIPIDSSLTLSHLFFADDAIFVGKWDSLNIRTIVNVLKCFHLASGMKINFHKSKLMGIDTRPEVDAAATTMGCSIFTTPFVHLGVKVWSIEATSEFSVKYVRQLIDDSILPKEEVTTRNLLLFGATNSRKELLLMNCFLLVSNKSVVQKKDSWSWLLDDKGICTVKSLRENIVEATLNSTVRIQKTKWNTYIPR
ncbi:hypothetical protein Tco_1110596 [Tanacetum coccineum]|uniref:Uncharacterized protein n=1 Tax=Tanacetum coccineum TaxID=301880 RepID=A0ABQ5ILC5_9ASTR